MPRGSQPGERRGGRQRGVPNKVTLAIKDLALEHGPAAIAEAARLVTKGKTEAVRLRAIEIILDRAYGKATQHVQHAGSVGSYDLTGISDENLRKLEAIVGPLAVAGGDPRGNSA